MSGICITNFVKLPRNPSQTTITRARPAWPFNGQSTYLVTQNPGQKVVHPQNETIWKTDTRGRYGLRWIVHISFCFRCGVSKSDPTPCLVISLKTDILGTTPLSGIICTESPVNTHIASREAYYGRTRNLKWTKIENTFTSVLGRIHESGCAEGLWSDNALPGVCSTKWQTMCTFTNFSSMIFFDNNYILLNY